MFDEWLQYISFAIGLVSVVATMLQMALRVRSLQKQLATSRRADFEQVISSNDIAKLGRYLDNVIGKFTVSDYDTNSKVSKQVDRYLDKVISFVGTDQEIVREEEAEKSKSMLRPEAVPFEGEFPFRGKLGVEYDTVIADVRRGEIWNALARLRRQIEMALKEIAKKKGYSFERPTSAGRLLKILENRSVIPRGIGSNLHYAISVCNKAIHGEDIDSSEAEEGIFHAGIGLTQLINLASKDT